MLLDIFQNFLVNTFSIIFVKLKGIEWQLMIKKFIYVVIVFKISDTDTSNLSLKLSKNIPVLSLTKTIKYSSNNESFLFRPGLLTISF